MLTTEDLAVQFPYTNLLNLQTGTIIQPFQLAQIPQQYYYIVLFQLQVIRQYYGRLEGIYNLYRQQKAIFFINHFVSTSINHLIPRELFNNLAINILNVFIKGVEYSPRGIEIRWINNVKIIINVLNQPINTIIYYRRNYSYLQLAI